MTFSIDIHQDTLVKKLKPAVVKVYDYYEPGENWKQIFISRFYFVLSSMLEKPKERVLWKILRANYFKLKFISTILFYYHDLFSNSLLESQAKVMYRIGEAECYGNKSELE
jgi:hypothetical protein